MPWTKPRWLSLVAVCSLVGLLGASSKQAWQTFTQGSGETHAFLTGVNGSYVNLCASQGGESAYLMLVSRAPGGSAVPHVAIIADANGRQRIQFRDDGGMVREISLSRLADVVDAAAAHQAENRLAGEQ